MGPESRPSNALCSSHSCELSSRTALLSSPAKQQASLGLVAFSHSVDTRGET